MNLKPIRRTPEPPTHDERCDRTNKMLATEDRRQRIAEKGHDYLAPSRAARVTVSTHPERHPAFLLRMAWEAAVRQAVRMLKQLKP